MKDDSKLIESIKDNLSESIKKLKNDENMNIIEEKQKNDLKNENDLIKKIILLCFIEKCEYRLENVDFEVDYHYDSYYVTRYKDVGFKSKFTKLDIYKYTKIYDVSDYFTILDEASLFKMSGDILTEYFPNYHVKVSFDKLDITLYVYKVLTKDIDF